MLERERGGDRRRETERKRGSREPLPCFRAREEERGEERGRGRKVRARILRILKILRESTGRAGWSTRDRTQN